MSNSQVGQVMLRTRSAELLLETFQVHPKPSDLIYVYREKITLNEVRGEKLKKKLELCCHSALRQMMVISYKRSHHNRKVTVPVFGFSFSFLPTS